MAKRFCFRLGLLFVSGAFGACELPTEEVVDFEPGTIRLTNFDESGAPLVRFDSDGNPIDAHGGQINLFGETYYLYGETYACGFQWRRQDPVPFCGFRVYSSPNLVEWTNHGLLFDVSEWEPWQARCHWWTYGCFRPHVVYNEFTRKYVLWVNAYADPVNYYVLESDSPVGPFVERATPSLAFNTDGPSGTVNNGDHNLFVDDDGSGYIIYTEWRESGGDQVIERLTPDYLSGTGEYVRVGTRGSESPSMFKRNGRYYVTASTPPNGAYFTSTTSYFTAALPLGPWSGAIEISRDSCGGQPFHVSELPSASGGVWYLYQSDLWISETGRAPGDPNQAPAALFWSPLRFSRDGAILPIQCRATYPAPAILYSAPAAGGEHWRLVCDVGTRRARGYLSREFRFRPTESGRLREVSINAYQRHEPNAPLRIDFRTVGDDGSGALLHRTSVTPKPPEWATFPEIAWTANKLTIPLDVPVTAGIEYAVRLHASLQKGCYGLAVQDGVQSDSIESLVSVNSGASWATEPARTVKADWILDPI